MPKKPVEPIAISPQTLRDALVESDDFGHEIRVKTCAEQRRAKVTHGWSYVDPLTGKPRQFDLRCTLGRPEFNRYFQLALECKNLAKRAPLVISGMERAGSEAFHDIVASGPIEYMPIRNRGVYRAAEENAIFPLGGFVGKNLIRFHVVEDEGKEKLAPMRERESDIYERWAQAVSSAHQLCKDALHAHGLQGAGNMTVVLPGVVVPDGTLWTVPYDRQGSCGSGPVMADQADLFLRHRVEVLADNYWIELSHVRFWTLTGLGRFLDDLNGENKSWSQWFPQNVVPFTPRVRER